MSETGAPSENSNWYLCMSNDIITMKASKFIHKVDFICHIAHRSFPFYWSYLPHYDAISVGTISANCEVAKCGSDMYLQATKTIFYDQTIIMDETEKRTGFKSWF